MPSETLLTGKCFNDGIISHVKEPQLTDYTLSDVYLSLDLRIVKQIYNMATEIINGTISLLLRYNKSKPALFELKDSRYRYEIVYNQSNKFGPRSRQLLLENF